MRASRRADGNGTGDTQRSEHLWPLLSIFRAGMSGPGVGLGRDRWGPHLSPRTSPLTSWSMC